MALYTFVYDDSTRRRRLVAYPGFVDTTTTNSGAPTTDFSISGVTIDSIHAIDVWMDGRLQVETTNYSRNTSLNKITFVSNVNTNSVVRIRVYLK